MDGWQQRVTGLVTGSKLGAVAVIFATAALLAGCGMFGGAAESPTPMPTRTPFPTFTATPPPAPTPIAATEAAAVQPDPSVPPATLPVTDAAQLQAPATALVAATVPETPTPVPATLTITGDLVNVRSGPGTEYELVGSAANGESFAVIARNAVGDWWQVCCVGGQNGWVFGELAAVQNAESVPPAADLSPAPVVDAPPDTPGAEAPMAEVPATPAPAETSAPAAETPPAPPAEAPAALAPYDPGASSVGNFDPNAQYQIVHFKVLGLAENNGGIRDSGAQHHIFLTVLDQNGNGVDGAVVRNLVGDKSEVVTGNKGPGKTEITMYYEPFKLAVASDPSGPVTSQVSNQMGLIFPHLPDIVGKLGDENYEYGACPTIDINCEWPLSAIHFSYEITFQKVK
jgi:hypothetical protein